MADGNDDDDAKLARALFRYRLIAEAAEAPKGARTAILREVVGAEHTGPDGQAVRVSLRTLQRWVKRFKRGGLTALGRASRKDKGCVRALPEAAVARVVALRNEGTWRSPESITSTHGQKK
jgi:putative transposase